MNPTNVKACSRKLHVGLSAIDGAFRPVTRHVDDAVKRVAGACANALGEGGENAETKDGTDAGTSSGKGATTMSTSTASTAAPSQVSVRLNDMHEGCGTGMRTTNSHLEDRIDALEDKVDQVVQLLQAALKQGNLRA